MDKKKMRKKTKLSYHSMKKKPGMAAKKKMSLAKKRLAAMYGNKNKITRGDIITAAKKNKKRKM